MEQVSSSNSANFWTSVLKISGGNEEPKAHPPAPKRPREQSFQEALTPSKKFAPVTPQANFDAYMDTTGSAELQGGGNVVTETPLLSQSSNGVHPAQVVEPEDPHLWDEWAVDIENRIQDVREYMGAIEKVLLGRVEGMFDQNQRERRNIDQKMAQIQQVLTEELETRIRQENPPMCLPTPAADVQLGRAYAEATDGLREQAERHAATTQGRAEEACRRIHGEGEKWIREIRQKEENMGKAMVEMVDKIKKRLAQQCKRNGRK